MSKAKLFIKPLTVGVEIGGLNAGAERDPDVREELYAAWLAHGMLLFSGIDTTERQLELSRCFGELELHPVPELRSDEHPLLAEIGGRKRKPAYVYDGEVLASRIAWHRDTAYTLDVCKGAMLRMVEVPSAKGETMFADTALAYEDLPADVKARLDGLEYKATMRVSLTDHVGPGTFWKSIRPATADEDPIGAHFDLGKVPAGRFPSIVHPVVLVHPESGRKCIFISPTYVDCFLGLPQKESDELLEYLVAHMLSPRYVYQHRWTVNQCILWDNHRFLHAANGHSPNEPRRALRTTLAGPLRTGRLFN